MCQGHDNVLQLLLNVLLFLSLSVPKESLHFSRLKQFYVSFRRQKPISQRVHYHNSLDLCLPRLFVLHQMAQFFRKDLPKQVLDARVALLQKLVQRLHVWSSLICGRVDEIGQIE